MSSIDREKMIKSSDGVCRRLSATWRLGGPYRLKEAESQTPTELFHNLSKNTKRKEPTSIINFPIRRFLLITSGCSISRLLKRINEFIHTHGFVISTIFVFSRETRDEHRLRIVPYDYSVVGAVVLHVCDVTILLVDSISAEPRNFFIKQTSFKESSANSYSNQSWRRNVNNISSIGKFI
jgi:hypothetical protein